jgi:hypothetical protein
VNEGRVATPGLFLVAQPMPAVGTCAGKLGTPAGEALALRRDIATTS